MLAAAPSWYRTGQWHPTHPLNPNGTDWIDALHMPGAAISPFVIDWIKMDCQS
jgi:hypothetical protein